MKVYRFILALLFLVLLGAPVQAHELWINMTEYSLTLFQHPKYAPTPQAKVIAYFGWGHKYPVKDMLDKKYLDTLTQIEPDGSKKEITVGETGFRAVGIKMESEGPRVFTAQVHPGFYQEVEGQKDFYNMRYEMYAKSLVSVGEVKKDDFTKPVGQRVEIVPTANPNMLKVGDTLSVQVLFDGKPAKEFSVKAVPMYALGEGIEKTKTDDKGNATFTIKDYAGPWLIAASKMEPATGKFAKQCKNFFYLSTMTFGVKKDMPAKK